MKYLSIPVWDIPTRLFHWGLVTSFCVSFSSGLADKFDGQDIVHQRSGIILLSLLIWRVLWGVFGSEASRFSSFVKGPASAVRHLKALAGGGKAAPDFTHNAAGSYAILLMLLLLLTQGVMGLFGTEGMFFSGPLSYLVPNETSEMLTGWHRRLAWAFLWLIGLHVSAVLYYSLAGDDVLTAMVTGAKSVEPEHAPDSPPRMRPWWLGLISMAAVITGMLAWLDR